MSGDELDSAILLVNEATKILLHLNPNAPLLALAEDLAEPERYGKFIDRFWESERGDWLKMPGSRVNTFCLSKYYLAMQEEVHRIIVPRFGPVEFLEKDRAIDSCEWITYWQQGASGFSGDEKVGIKYAKQMNSDLALRFFFKVDPRMIANSGTDDPAMSPIIRKALNILMGKWGFEWEWKPVGYGESEVMLCKLLGYEAGHANTEAVGSFGIRTNDQETGRWLISGLANEEPVMEQHLWKQLTGLVSLAEIYTQIQRAPSPSYR